MASLIPGFEYDIFISYRQKDNKYDGWVTEFVGNLKKELEATFKEDISVYFDINPHDGLLESHEVQDSLQEKLKCLIFIPVISQTYCDPKSFAWQHEFKAFIELASQDNFGLKVRLTGGNVASRILPVRIYDLNKEDISLCESVLGGTLRGIEFIYKASGVNRPLRTNEDHAQDNLNKTYYRDQINKMSHSIQEIIKGLRTGEPDLNHEIAFQPPGSNGVVKNLQQRIIDKRPLKKTGIKVLYGFLILAILIALILTFPGIVKNGNAGNIKSDEVLEKAIAVCDPLSVWANYIGKIRIIYVTSNGKIYSDQIIEINTKENFYKCSSVFFGKFKVVSGIKDGKCFLDTENPEEYEIKKIGLDCKLITGLKEHHYCIFGLLMELKSSGLLLDKGVEREKFQGQDCLSLHFFKDSTKTINNYYSSNEWTVYIDPKTYLLLGYKSKGATNWTVNYSGYFKAGDINVPLSRINYNTIDNSLLSVELILLPE